MKIVIAPDSFKESLSALGVAQAIAQGVRDVLPDAQTLCVPMADGGEGTLDAVLAATGGERRTALVKDALGRPRQADWGWLPDQTALVEMASAAGLEHIAVQDRDVLRADTWGVGQLILAALDAGAKTVVLTAGGSATNDGGTGMLRALGLVLMDAQGQPLAPGGLALQHLHRIDATQLDVRLKSLRMIIATDVNNPLCGAQGASAIFGPQKGATPEMVQQLDIALSHWANQTAHQLGRDEQHTPGAGAAGGLGFAAMAWLGAQMRPGASMVAALVKLDQALEGADLVFTGEGRMDAQTLQGKTPMAVIEAACQQGTPVIALVGGLGAGYQQLYQHGLTAAFSLVDAPMSLQEACRQASDLLRTRSADIMRTWLRATGAASAHRSSE
jgi:glycerate kinase